MDNAEQTANTQQAKLFAALAKAQGDFLPIEKNRSVTIRSEKGSYAFRYADLEETISKTRPALSANGLALLQRIEPSPSGPVLVCTLVHAEGGSISSELSIAGVRDMGDPKKFGAAMTYLRRYLVTAILGVAADDDLDEDAEGVDIGSISSHQGAARATGRGKPEVSTPQRRQTAPAEPQEDRAEPAADDGAMATAGEINYIKKKLTASGLTVEQVAEREGLQSVDIERLTKAEFIAIKAGLL